MSAISDILNALPIGDIAKQLGVDDNVAESAVNLALPALLGGLQANAQDDKGASSLAKALSNHNGKIDGKVDVEKVDTEDGKKIVKNIFGDKTENVVSALSAVPQKSESGGLGDIIGKVLPILAPIVLTYLGSQLFSSKKEEEVQAQPADAIGSLLGGLLGGGTQKKAAAKEESNGLGDLVGGFLNSGGGDIIGNVLGGLLGGGKR